MKEERRRQGLRDVKPQIDTRPPKSLQYKRQGNGKRDELERQRYEAIEEENRRILFRMHEEFQKPPRYMEKSFSLPQVRGPGDPTPQRRREVEHIAKENLLLLHRIQTMKPEITSNADLALRNKNHKGYVRLKSEYPLVSFSTRPKSLPHLGKSVDQFPARAQSSPSAGAGKVNKGDSSASASQPNSSDNQGMEANSRAAVPEEFDEDQEAAQEDAGLHYIFSEEMKLGDLTVQVEMVSDGRVLAISAFDLDSEKSYELLLSEANHVAMHEEASGSYGKIAQRLRIQDGQLVLDPL